MSSPHTQIENEYGYNGYNLWVTSDKHIEGTGDEGLWTGGGYEGIFWIDRKRKFGLIMTQIYSPNEIAANKEMDIRGLIYKEIFKKRKIEY